MVFDDEARFVAFLRDKGHETPPIFKETLYALDGLRNALHSIANSEEGFSRMRRKHELGDGLRSLSLEDILIVTEELYGATDRLMHGRQPQNVSTVISKLNDMHWGEIIEIFENMEKGVAPGSRLGGHADKAAMYSREIRSNAEALQAMGSDKIDTGRNSTKSIR